MTLIINGPDPGVDFLVDSLSLTELTSDNSWKCDADKRINSELRKGMLKVVVRSKLRKRVNIEVG